MFGKKKIKRKKDTEKKRNKKPDKRKKIWSVSTLLSEHLFAVRHLNKPETANISIYNQNKCNI